MASFLENIEPFRGTGERNKDGQTLEEFLEGYQPYRYETPSCTTDAVVFSYRGMEEQIRDVSYRVREPGKIAVDHSAILVQALLKLQGRMEGRISAGR